MSGLGSGIGGGAIVTAIVVLATFMVWGGVPESSKDCQLGYMLFGE